MKSPTHLVRDWYRQAALKKRQRQGRVDPQVKLLRQYDIDLVLDVGANTGQYAKWLFKKGYQGRLISFEPQPDAFSTLEQNASSYQQWNVSNLALGSEETLATLNVAGNSQSSSLHAMLDRHVESAPDSAYTGKVDVQVRRVDDVLDEMGIDEQRIFMKLDVQGHEHETLRGATGCLDRLLGIEIELSLVGLYEGQRLWRETIDSMKELGFELASLRPCFNDPQTSVLLQADGVFVRPGAAEIRRAA